ncbi:MAG: HD domain-containing protein [Eggerthellales bacterium]|nr:HD domain-containing protein [Eggerthellales bacterium]
MAKDPRFVYTPEELAYLKESRALAEAGMSPYASRHEDAIYEGSTPEFPDPLRPAYVRDVDRVLNNAFFNRCMDKTQVFPFYQNDDVTRRSYHLQIVSSLSRKIAGALRLNTALAEAIALGHDIGHTPFGHGGERMLSNLYHEHTGRYFNHNVHSVRVLRTVSNQSFSLQMLNGVLCHCGEKAFVRYEPSACESFDDLDAMMTRCYENPGESQNLRPCTLEGCVVRICDILAYLGKDRQDALTLKVLGKEQYNLPNNVIGTNNSSIIANVTTNLLKNSIGKPYIAMDPEVLEGLNQAKALNSQQIYTSPEAHEKLDSLIAPMMQRLYERFREDLLAGDESSPIFRHHVHAWVMEFNEGYVQNSSPDDIVVDYIASMTDRYFIDVFNYLYPDERVDVESLYHPYIS